jgi:phospholipid N-methyltransferase
MFSRFLRSPRTVGALSPSSRALAREIASRLPERRPCRVIELGPGTGALTEEILKGLGREDRFVAVELEPDFVRQLRQRWPTLEVVCGSAARLHDIATDLGMAPVDQIISGLPFATLPGEVTRQILENVEKTLRPGGRFTTFQYAPSYRLVTGVAFRRQMTARMGAKPERKLVVRNVPPAFVLTWRKGGGLDEPPRT